MACLSAMFVCNHELVSGNNLEELQNKCFTYLDFIKDMKQEYTLNLHKITTQHVLNLVVSNGNNLIGVVFNEVEMLPLFQSSHDYTSLIFTYISKLNLSCIFRNCTEAVSYIAKAEPYLATIPGTTSSSQYLFYSSLALLANFAVFNETQCNQYLEKIEANQHKMKKWAHYASMNYKHKYDLVEAEKARVLDNKLEAMDYYDMAIKGASTNGYIHDEALACELASEFYSSLGKDLIAQTYLTKAYYAYTRWGATAKVKQLEKNYSYLGHRAKENNSFDVTMTSTSTNTDNLTLDVTSVVKASQTLSQEINLNRLLDKLLQIVKENAGAQQVFFIVRSRNELIIESSLRGDEDDCTVLQRIPVKDSYLLPISLINYVERTQKYIVLDDATQSKFNLDPYIVTYQPKSVLVMPIIYRGNLQGILYLENNLAKGAFTDSSIEVLQLIAAQAAISLENAHFYSTLEQRVNERTQKLENALEELRRTQLQMIQSEKMSSLGQLVAGIAHEINNPISFIYGNLIYTHEYVNSLLQLIDIYIDSTSEPSASFVQKAQEIDFEYIREDIPRLMNSMEKGAARISDIVKSLRNFSRLDEAATKEVDIHEGIESTLIILQQKLVDIQVIKDYVELPQVFCCAAEINQVLMSLLTNAIDAVLEGVGDKITTVTIPTIWIRTELRNKNFIAISIADNGMGMTEDVQSKIFDPFFTTKTVGKGTGLGLAIAYQIIVDKHAGSIICESTPGEGTEFTVLLPC